MIEPTDPPVPQAQHAKPTTRAPRRVPWRVVFSIVALLVGATLCLANKGDAGMFVLAAAVAGLGGPGIARAVKGQ